MSDKSENSAGGKKTGRGSVATIYDVAKQAGVSKTTVSRVVNGEPGVRAETLARVREAMETLNYLPNKAARSLASKGETRIGLLYNNPSVAYFNELLIGALEGCGRHGAQLVVAKCEVGDAEASKAAIGDLIKGGINGMLLTAPLSETTDVIRKLDQNGVATVGLATGGERQDISCVGIDDFHAAYEMTQYLIELGHRRIGFVRGHPGHTSSRQRHHGFLAAIRDAGKKVQESVVVEGRNSYRSGIEAGEALLSQKPSVTAIFAGNDDMASGVISVAHRKGLNVPRDLSVSGFDDTIAGNIWPEMTTVRQPISDIAVQAIDVIVQNIYAARSGEDFAVQNIPVAHKLVVRESTGPVFGR